MNQYLSLNSIDVILRKLISATLLLCITKVTHWKTLLTTSTKAQDPNERKVYDLVNVENGHRFVVYGEQPMVVSNCIQSTGHGILTLYIRLVSEELDRQKIPWNPVILDLHDATTVETPTEYAEQVAEVMRWGIAEVNRILDWKIKHSGIPVIGDNLADVKEPEA